MLAPVLSAVALFSFMAIALGSIALADVISSIGSLRAVKAVDKERALMCYATTMQIVMNWMVQGLITEEEYSQIDTITAEKFGVSTRSIWRRNNLRFCQLGGNMPATKGGISDGENNHAGSPDEAG